MPFCKNKKEIYFMDNKILIENDKEKSTESWIVFTQAKTPVR